jgi:transposase
MSVPSSKILDHHGLVAGFCHSLGFADIIDKAIGGAAPERKITCGQLVTAMVLNGLGFTGRTLHMYSEYFRNKPVDRLIGEGVLPEHINDDALGRCLDNLYEYGVSDLYQQLGEAVVAKLGLATEALHLDSTSFHYDGQATEDDEPRHIRIAKGYSRDHRPELNQVILNLICENQSGIPVYMRPASGNSNDMEGFKQIVKAHIGSLKAAQASRYLVADAALYVKETIEHLDTQGQLFITRVPQTLKEAKELVKQAPALTFMPICDGYEGVSYDSDYAGVKQKWLLIRSEQAYKREQHSLNKRMLKAGEQARKSFKTLCQQRFACAQDAQSAIVKWQSKQTVCDVNAQVIEIAVYSSAGRPKLGELPIRIEYQITGVLCTLLASRQNALQQLGLFIIATNDISSDVDMGSLLSSYKAQQNVEKGFRFLKSPDFLTSAIYLKKPERIEALLMVMTCCLMVYAGLEHQIRKSLVENDCYFPSMKYKPEQRPTARWVFQCFEGIAVIYLPDKTVVVANLQTRNQTIIDCLGDKYQKIYS